MAGRTGGEVTLVASPLVLCRRKQRLLSADLGGIMCQANVSVKGEAVSACGLFI